MNVRSLTPILVAAVSLSLATACARDARDPRPGPAEPAATRPAPTKPSRPEPPPAPVPKLSREELEAEFEVQQQRINVAVETLEREHRVYAIEKSWMARTIDYWTAWAARRKDRAAIHRLIQQVGEAAERQVQIASQLKNADLTVRAEVERDRANKLLSSLDEFDAQDHNKYQ